MRDFNFFAEEENQKKRRGINVIPLINIAFLLLMFFMLTSNFIANKTIQLNVGEEKSDISNSGNEEAGEVAEGNKQELKVYIKAESLQKILLNEKQTNDISGEIKLLAGGKTDFPVLVEAGEKLTVQEIITLIELVQKAGTNNITIF